ncbi:unnamed protein product [Lasius platythorax]|uniref:Uncharacterized protein n=1 Tax=Lasius platythorax TaxID=488582 RepID=A0AAV2MZ21_9HYME
MLRAKQEIKRIARMDIEKFVKDVKDVQSNLKMDKTKKKRMSYLPMNPVTKKGYPSRKILKKQRRMIHWTATKKEEDSA